MKKINEKATPYIVKGLISLGIAVAGGYYISTIHPQEPKYSPTEVKTGKYNLVDVNNDKKVDLIKVDGIIKYRNKSEDITKILKEIPDYLFFEFGKHKPITPDIQRTSDSVFNKKLNEKALERVLAEGK